MILMQPSVRIYDKGASVNLTASFSSLGYVFTGWGGDLSGTGLNQAITMSDHRSITDFFCDTADSDGDGLTNYAELVTHSTNPNDSDSDDDGLTDGEEINKGTNPNLADSDSDGVDDFQESIDLTDPLDGNSMLPLAVAGGQKHTLIIKTDGSLWANWRKCWSIGGRDNGESGVSCENRGCECHPNCLKAVGMITGSEIHRSTPVIVFSIVFI